MYETVEDMPDRSALEMEYRALRDEILVRIDLRQKLLAMSLILVGAFLGFFANNPEYKYATLVYPPLAALIAVAWVQDDYGIRHASLYIKEYIETELPALRWEHYKTELRRTNRKHNMILSSHLVIILLTQCVAAAIGWSFFTTEWYMWILAVLELLSILFVIYLCIDWWQSGKSIAAKSIAILKMVRGIR
jgi:hypothetical protein